MTNITEAMHYANIQEKMALLGITDESVAKKAQEIGIVTAEEQKKAEEALWQKSIIDHEEKIAQARISIKGVEPIDFKNFSFHQNQSQTIIAES